MMRSAVFILLALGGCGVLPRTSTGDELMDAVLTRVDPLGDCAIVGEESVIFKDILSDGPPGMLTHESFVNPDVRAAALAIAVPYRTYVPSNAKPVHFGVRKSDDCAMHLSMAAYSETFAFIEYSSPGGAIGAYAFQKSGTRWRVIEHKQLGYW